MATEENAPKAPGAAREVPVAASPSPSGASAKSTKHQDRRVKLAFLLVVIATTAWVTYHQLTQTQLTDWSNDLPAALAQAAKEGRPVVAIIYDSPTDYDYGRLQVVVEKEGNRKAMKNINALRVATRNTVEAAKYGVTKYPTTLLLNSNGQVQTAWAGYIPEIEFRQRFLKGEPQER
jgi:hypothetical protein